MQFADILTKGSFTASSWTDLVDLLQIRVPSDIKEIKRLQSQRGSVGSDGQTLPSLSVEEILDAEDSALEGKAKAVTTNNSVNSKPRRRSKSLEVVAGGSAYCAVGTYKNKFLSTLLFASSLVHSVTAHVTLGESQGIQISAAMAADSDDPRYHADIGSDGQTLQPLESDSQRVDLSPSSTAVIEVDSDIELTSPVEPWTKEEKMYVMATAREHHFGHGKSNKTGCEMTCGYYFFKDFR